MHFTALGLIAWLIFMLIYRWINHVEAVGGSNHQHIVLLLQPVDLRQQLIHHRIAVRAAAASAVATSTRATGPAAAPGKGVNLVDDDDVEQSAFFLALPLFFGRFEELPHFLLGGAK